MDIENLKIILRVAECLSINKASLLSYKTQSQVSRIVKNFEELVNVQIFERSTKGVKIAPKGEEILEYCRKITALYDEMVWQNINQQKTDYHGNLNFYTPINIHSDMGKILGSFSTHYPHISINYKTVHNDDIIEKLSKDDDAIGMITPIYLSNKKPIVALPSKLIYEEISMVPIVALCCASAPFAAKYKSLSAKTLTTLPLIQYNPYENKPSTTMTLLQAMQVKEINFHYTTDDFRVFQQLLIGGYGVYIGVMPAARLLSENIIGIPIRSQIKVGFGILMSQNSTSKMTHLFKDYLIAYYQKIY